MLKVGITGGIGSGKSYVCRKLQEMGCPVYCCDNEARRLMLEDNDIKQELGRLLGQDAYLPDGALNKSGLAGYLFASEEHARQVNAIVHPRVKRDFLQWAVRQRRPIVFMESAILLEARFEDVVDKVVLVSAPRPLRTERAMARSGLSQADVEERMSRQWDEERLRARADAEIINDGTADVDGQLKNILEQLERNL